MMAVGNALQSAFFTALTGLPDLTALVGAQIYDAVPQDAQPPYVTIGDDTVVPWETQDHLGYDATVTIHSWSRARGRQEVKAIQDVIAGRLHHSTLLVTGATVSLLEEEMRDSFQDPDGITYHGVQRFRCWLQASE